MAKTPLRPPLRRVIQSEDFAPPEGVPIALELASLGARLGAVILDLIATWLILLVVIGFVWWIDLLPDSALGALFLLLNFALGVPYFILAELVWNGRTIGKRMVGIRVVSLGGTTLAPHQIVVRNLLKEAEFFAPFGALFSFGAMAYSTMAIVALWVVVVSIIFWRSKRKQRLGDIVADTIVIVSPKAAMLQDIALASKAQSKFQFDQGQLDIYGRYELQALESILHEPAQTIEQLAHLAKVANTIAKRIGFAGTITQADATEFLTTFYREQREWLETRQLFGDKREDKFHKAKPNP